MSLWDRLRGNKEIRTTASIEPGALAERRKRLGVLAIMKNEAMNLREWIDHYRWQGVDKIFLIDNGSDDGGPQMLADEIAQGFVQLFRLSTPHRQLDHYRTAFVDGRIRDQVEWLAVADLDEFWFSPNSNLREPLENIDYVDLIYSNWKMFGSSGYESHPTSLRRCLTLRDPQLANHYHTKWICRTSAIEPDHMEVHKIRGVDSARVVSDNIRLHLNHYPTQSLEYFTKVKMTRGDVISKDYDAVRSLEYFKSHDRPATFVDRLLADMLDSVR